MMTWARIKRSAIVMGTTAAILAGNAGGIGAATPKRQAVLSPVGRASGEHPAGCYLIWANRDLHKTCNFLKGGQIMVQWEDVAPERGKYDWAKVDKWLQFYAELGQPTTVQVNANRKPAWLWNYVASCGSSEGYGRDRMPQYWDPRYLEIQTELINALANHLKASPHKHLILCIRASFNAAGTEGFFVRRADRSPSDTWDYPPDGHHYPVPWTREEFNKYGYRVMRAYVEAFKPEINVVLRPGIFMGDQWEQSGHLMDKDGAGIFGTGGDFEHRPRPDGTLIQHNKYHEESDVFAVETARSGRTVAYWEAWGNATEKWRANPASWNYWRILYELHKGVTYVAVPDCPMPGAGFPGVVCLHGTTNWGARRTLGLPSEPDDPQANKGGVAGKDYARQLVRRGYVTISPEHFCAAARTPPEGPYNTAAFYRKHPDWSAVGKYVHDSRIACSVLAARRDVDATRLGVTGHSLGGQGSIWLAAYDERIRCAAPSCCALTFRENPRASEWSRERWYIYFPQLREHLLSGRGIQCDFHEMMALIAPRPLLARFALNDGDPTGQSHRTMLHLKLHELYRLLECERAHAFLVFGDGHFIPDTSSETMLSWMDRWLKYDGDPLGAWDAQLTRTT